MGDESEETYVYNKLVRRIYYSKEIEITSSPGEKKRGRYASRILEECDRTHFGTIEKEVVLRVTPSGREEIRAFFLVDDRSVRTLHLQRFSRGLPRERVYFTLTGAEIQKLLDLVVQIKAAPFGTPEKETIEDRDLRNVNLTADQLKAILQTKANLRVVAEMAEREVTKRDVVAFAYRRNQLNRFKQLLEDSAFFDREKERLGKAEAVWQEFLEANPWIFGYGLFYVFTTGYDDKRLEQVVAGADVESAGKRADALLKTRGRVSSLCFVEIKTHRTELLQEQSYRSETWRPSDELSGAVAQAQKTVESAERKLSRRLTKRDEKGNPTGDGAYLIRPRSVVVAGSLQQFVADASMNRASHRLSSTGAILSRQRSSPLMSFTSVRASSPSRPSQCEGRPESSEGRSSSERDRPPLARPQNTQISCEPRLIR